MIYEQRDSPFYEKPRAAIFIFDSWKSNIEHDHITSTVPEETDQMQKTKKILKKNNVFFQILWTLSALITGFAFAIASRPTSLKSKLHSCFSGYL